MEYSINEVAYMFGLSPEELSQMAVSEVCEYMIRTDDEEEDTVHVLLSDGFNGFFLIADTSEETYMMPLGEGSLVVPNGTFSEVFSVIESVRNGELETLH